MLIIESMDLEFKYPLIICITYDGIIIMESENFQIIQSLFLKEKNIFGKAGFISCNEKLCFLVSNLNVQNNIILNLFFLF